MPLRFVPRAAIAACCVLAAVLSSSPSALAACGNGALESGEECDDGSQNGNSCCSSSCTLGGESPDVIVGDLWNTKRHGTVGGITAYSIGTSACNVGTCWLNWFSSIPEHPVIGQNMFRLKDGRFEQIGQSWLKHGFTAAQGSDCSSSCNPAPSGAHLGVNCSDPYSAGRNGSQSNLGPKEDVNAYTGVYPYPDLRISTTGDVIFKRLQVHNTDLDPAQNAGALYFVEGQYVTHDDATAHNNANNASYRPVTVGASPYNLTLTGTTQRQKAAIQAWKATDPSVTELAATVPGDGVLIVSAKASSLGAGLYHYEYAVENVDCHRSAQSFSVPIPAGAAVSNVGFHDVDYHSGEPFSGTDWSSTTGPGSVSWTTEGYATDPNTNALRWGTLYNFRFDANVVPATGSLSIGLFRPGSPSSIAVGTVTPGSCATTETLCGDGADDDCDAHADCADADCCASAACAASDADGDHFAAVCDCNDASAAVYPGAPQLCDGINNDCNAPGWPAMPANEADADADGVRICAGDCDDANAQRYPGNTESCDGIDNDCVDGVPANETDADGDGVATCEGDCDDGDGSGWATPGETQDLVLTHAAGTTTLIWGPPASPGCTSPRYDTLRALIPSDFINRTVCIETDGTDTTSFDVDTPPEGSVFCYLTRAKNDCPSGQGSLGTDSDDNPRSGRTCP